MCSFSTSPFFFLSVLNKIRDSLPPNSRNPFPRLFLGKGKIPKSSRGKTWRGHESVRSIGTSKIVLTRENDQIHTVQSLWHTSSRGRTVDLERTSRYRNAYHVTTSTSHSVPHMWVVLRVRGIHCGSVNLLGRTEVL